MSRLPEAVSCQGHLKQCHVKVTWSWRSPFKVSHLSTDNKTSLGIKYCMTTLTRYSWINYMDQNRCYMCILQTSALYFVVITWQYNPPISQFNNLCHEFMSVWSNSPCHEFTSVWSNSPCHEFMSVWSMYTIPGCNVSLFLITSIRSLSRSVDCQV